MKKRTSAGAVMSAALLAAACGSSGPTVPSSPAPIPAAQACEAVGSIGSIGSMTGGVVGILSGADCSPQGPVVKLNMRDGLTSAGSCSGTIISPRVVLTAAHCLDENPTEIRVWLGVGPEFTAASFITHPQYSEAQLQFDVGVVFMNEDFPRAPASVLTSRLARVGEAALIAGFGRNEREDTTTLRAASTTIAAATALRLESRYAPPSGSICSGDSGGPIFVSEGGTWAIAGISSATTQRACNTGTNFYQGILHEQVRAFIAQHAPSARQR